jgi:hypothetical protein
LHEKSRSETILKMNGRIEAQLTLLACSEPPEGRSKWSLRLLEDRLVETENVDSSHIMSTQRAIEKK